MKDSPLNVRVENNQLIISIGINTLAFASSWENGGPVENLEIEKGKELAWAKQILYQIEKDESESQAPINKFLDEMIENAAEDLDLDILPKGIYE
jgi:hypothetical protein